MSRPAPQADLRPPVAASDEAAPSAGSSRDASWRFVLPESAPYLANLAALWVADARLAERIEATHGRASYPSQPTRAGPPTATLPGPGGRSILLHSRYQPIDEARKLIESADAAANAGFYVLGFGLGYHALELFDQTGGEKGSAPIIIFEPDPLLLRTAFEQVDCSRLLGPRRVQWLTSLDKTELFNRLTPLTAALSMGVGWVRHGPSVQADPDFYAQVESELEEFRVCARTNLNTLLLNSTRTAENVARNVGWYASAPCPSRLKDLHAGKPAIIVSAGPSLRKNQRLLRDAKSGAVLIAVQTTLKPLLEMGVEPDYVTSLDYHEICTRFFEGLPPRIGVELVAEPKATTGIFRLHPGALTLLGNDYAESLLREMKLDKPTLPAGATVAHLAYYLAEHLGCDPIIFVGQDLGFSDGLCYAPGTSYEDVWRPELGRFCSLEMKQWDQIVRERYILRKVPDWHGRSMYTEQRLFSYLQQFEADFLASKRMIIDATEGGAAKRGATPMPLAEALRVHCAREIDRSGAKPAVSNFNGSRLAQVIDCLVKRREESARIEQISQLTLPLLDEIRGFIDDQARVDRAISRIDGLRGQMNELGATYDLVAQLNQKSQLTRFEADRRLAGEQITGVERQRRQVERDAMNVQAMRDAAVRFQSLMDEAIAQVEVQLGSACLSIREAA